MLLLEDDLTARDLLLRVINSALSGMEHNVYIAENGNEASNIIKHHGEKIVLFTTDVIHPGTDTLELIKEAKNKNSQIKIILLTGSVAVDKEYDSLVDFTLTKPFSNESLSEFIHSIFF